MLTTLLAAPILIFLGWWGFNVLSSPKPVNQIKGVVVAYSGDNAVIKQSSGSEIEVPVEGMAIGESVHIVVYRSSLTGTTEYRLFRKYSVEVVGE